MPGTGRFTPRGSGATGSAALGNRSDCWASDTFFRVARDRPPTSPIAAAAALTPAATRNCRRAGGPTRPSPAGFITGGPARSGLLPPAQDPAGDPAGAPPPAGTQPTLSSSSPAPAE